MDFNQTCTDIGLGNETEVVRFWRSETVKNVLSLLCLLNKQMDFNVTSIDKSLRNGK